MAGCRPPRGTYTEAVRLGPGDVVFGMLSMSRIFGYTLQLLSPLSVGATIVAAPAFDAPSVVATIGRHRVTHLYGLPVMFDTLTRQPLTDRAGLKLNQIAMGHYLLDAWSNVLDREAKAP